MAQAVSLWRYITKDEIRFEQIVYWIFDGQVALEENPVRLYLISVDSITLSMLHINLSPTLSKLSNWKQS
jgi:hypothetical protein